MDSTKAEILQQDEELARTMVRQLRSIGWVESNIELALDNIALYRFGPKPSLPGASFADARKAALRYEGCVARRAAFEIGMQAELWGER